MNNFQRDKVSLALGLLTEESNGFSCRLNDKNKYYLSGHIFALSISSVFFFVCLP